MQSTHAGHAGRLLRLGSERRDQGAECQNNHEDGPWGPHTNCELKSTWLIGTTCTMTCISGHSPSTRSSRERP
jgi:hypothetical protein